MQLRLPLKIGLYTLFISGLGVLGLAVATYQRTSAVMGRNSVELLRSYLAADHRSIQATLQRFLQVSESVGSLPSVVSYLESVSVFPELDVPVSIAESTQDDLERTLETYPEVAGILLYTWPGKYPGSETSRIYHTGRCTQAHGGMPHDLTAIENTLLSELFSPEVGGECAIRGPVMKGVSTAFGDTDTNLFALVRPVRDPSQRRVLGALIMTLDGSWLRQALPAHSEHVTAFIADESGRILYDHESGFLPTNSDAHRRYLNEIYPERPVVEFIAARANQLTQVSVMLSDQRRGAIALKRLYYDTTNPRQYWILGVSGSREFVHSAVQGMLQSTVLMVVVTCMVLSLLTALAVQDITLPLQRLAEAADRIRQGEEGVAIPLTGTVEVSILSESMAAMIAALQESREQLSRANEGLRSELDAGSKELAVLRDALMTASNGFIIADMQSKVTYVNPIVLSLFQFSSKEQVLGKELEVFGTPEISWPEIEAQVREHGYWSGQLVMHRSVPTPPSFPGPMRRPASSSSPDARQFGERQPSVSVSRTRPDSFSLLPATNECVCELFVSHAHDTEGKLVATVISLRDITSQMSGIEALRRSEERFRTLVDSMEDLVFVTDGDLRMLSIHGYWLTKVGIASPEHFIHKRAVDFLDEKSARYHLSRAKNALAGGSVVYDWKFSVNQRKCLLQISLSPLRDSKGKVSGLVGVGRDVTSLREAEQALQESEEQNRALVEHSPDGIFVHADGQFLFANEAGFKLMNAARSEEVIGAYVDDFFSPNSDEVSLTLTAGLPVIPEFTPVERRLFPIRGEAQQVEVRSGPIHFKGRKAELLVVRDISERRALEENQRRLTNAFRKTTDIIIITDANGAIEFVNPAFEALTGYQDQEVIGRSVAEFDGGDYDAEFYQTLADQLEPGQDFRDVFTVRCRNGAVYREARTITRLQDEMGLATGLFFIGKDVTQEIMMREQLERSLEEKEVLLREVHHRVKNNLQVIISILRMQARIVKNEEFTRIVKECQDRIQSMALVHERLYATNVSGLVDFPTYLQELLGHIKRSHGAVANRIAMQVEVDPAKLSISTAIACGLVVNELVSNAYKHAFPGDRTGRIVIRYKEVSPANFVLEVQDDGIGCPQDLDIRTSPSLGLRLVGSLVKDQLRGELRIAGQEGTTTTVRFTDLGTV